MKKATCFPYLRPAEEAVSLHCWRAGGIEAFPDGIHRKWDPLTDITIERRLEIDVARVIKECKLPRDARMRACASWYSPGTQLRSARPATGSYCDFSALGTNITANLKLQISGPLLAGAVRVRTELILLSPGTTFSDISPRIPGQVLFREFKEVSLEGLGSRFPIEVVRFPESTRLCGWSLKISEDLDRPFLGGVRLLVNCSHPAVLRAISANPPGLHDRVLMSAIYFDIGRQLLLVSLDHPDFLARLKSEKATKCSFLTGSIGAALADFLRTFFQEDSLDDLRAIKDSNPTKFETVVKQRLRLFDQVDGQGEHESFSATYAG